MLEIWYPSQNMLQQARQVQELILLLIELQKFNYLVCCQLANGALVRVYDYW